MVKKLVAIVATKRKDNAETLVVAVATVQKTWTRHGRASASSPSLGRRR
jgi:hypothetical protein